MKTTKEYLLTVDRRGDAKVCECDGGIAGG